MLQSIDRDGIRTRTYAFVVLFLLVGAVFFPVLGGEFLHWDVDFIISQNRQLNGPAWQVIQWSLTDTGYLMRYQPLCWLTWAAIRQCFGLDPFYFHLAVLIFHAVNSGLVFLLIRKLLMLAAPKSETDSRPLSICAVLAAGVWAVHPLRVETTAWAVELVFVQPLFFFLLSLLSYLRAAESNKVRARAFYQVSVLLFLCRLTCLLSAEGLWVDLWCLRRWIFFPLRRLSMEPVQWFTKPERVVWLEKIPFAVVAVFFGLLNLHVRAVANTEVKPATLTEFGVIPRLMQAFFIWAHNFWKPFAPFHLTPIPAQLVDFKPFAPLFIFSAVLVICLTIVLLLKRRHWPGMFAIWMCYLALLVPVLGLSEHPHYSADRYSLIVGIGWSILLAGLLVKVWPRFKARSILLAITAILICGLSVLSRRQTDLWKTNVGFFRAMIAQLQNQPKLDFYRLEIYQRLAAVYGDRGDLAAAAETLRSAIRIWPDVIKPYCLLGETLEKAGDLDGAKASYLAAVRLDPTLLPTLNDLGVVYAKAGKFDQAETLFAEVLHQDPSKESALRNMVKALNLQGKTNEAGLYLQKLENASGAGHPAVK